MDQAKFLQHYGPWALVTGASDGIGQAFCEKLAEYGFHLILVARRQDRLQIFADDLAAKFQIQTAVFALDLAQPDAVSMLYERTKNYAIGLVVAAAGFGSSGLFLNQSLGPELQMIDVNCKSCVALAHQFGQRMKTQQRGGLILFGSLVGFQGVPYATTYGATKAFMQNFAEGLFHELKPYGVDVLCVAPGPVMSGFSARAQMTMSLYDKPDVVAKESLNKLGKIITIRPGFVGKVLSFGLLCVPRFLRSHIMGRIMKNMTQHGG